MTIDPIRYFRQIKIFHDFTKFKNLGIIYENNKNGKSYASLDQIEKLIKEKKLNLISCYSIDEETNDQSIREKSVLQCLNKLTRKSRCFLFDSTIRRQ